MNFLDKNIKNELETNWKNIKNISPELILKNKHILRLISKTRSEQEDLINLFKPNYADAIECGFDSYDDFFKQTLFNAFKNYWDLCILKYLSPLLQDDLDVASILVGEYFGEIEFVSQRLRKNKDIVKLALELNGINFEKVSPLHIDLLKRHIYENFVDQSLYNDKTFLFNLCIESQNFLYIEYINGITANDSDFMSLMSAKNLHCFSYASLNLQKDDTFILKICNNLDTEDIEHMITHYYYCKAFPEYYQSTLFNKIITSENCSKVIALKYPEYYFFPDIDPQILIAIINDRSLLMNLIRYICNKDDPLLDSYYATEKINELEQIINNNHALNHLSLHSDAEIMAILINHNPIFITKADKYLFHNKDFILSIKHKIIEVIELFDTMDKTYKHIIGNQFSDYEFMNEFLKIYPESIIQYKRYGEEALFHCLNSTVDKFLPPPDDISKQQDLKLIVMAVKYSSENSKVRNHRYLMYWAIQTDHKLVDYLSDDLKKDYYFMSKIENVTNVHAPKTFNNYRYVLVFITLLIFLFMYSH